jgi:hypothetical protein
LEIKELFLQFLASKKSRFFTVSIHFRAKKDTLKVFYDLLKESADKMSASPPSAPANLAPPHEIYEWINRLVKEI